MLVTFAGLHGTGKTTVAKCIADRFELDHYSTGMIFREMAEKMSMSLVEFSQYASKHKDVDMKLDKKMKSLGMKGNCVLDGQLCWYFLKNEADWKILLTCDEETRIQRIFNREQEKKGDTITLDEVRNETLERERIESARYEEIYGINISDMEFMKKNHDIVIDTTGIDIDEVVEKIISLMTVSN